MLKYVRVAVLAAVINGLSGCDKSNKLNDVQLSVIEVSVDPSVFDLSKVQIVKGDPKPIGVGIPFGPSNGVTKVKPGKE